MVKPAVKFSEKTQHVIDRLSDLNSKIEQKKKALSGFQSGIQAHDEILSKLKADAEKMLLEGQNPTELLQKAAMVELELNQMRRLLSGPGDISAAEKKEREELKSQLSSLLCKDFNNSDFRRKKQQEFKQKLMEVWQLAEDVESAQSEIGKTYGVQFNSPSIYTVDDRALYFWITHELHHIRLQD